MTRRKQRWLARSFFVSFLGVIPAGLLYFLSTVNVHNTRNHWWPYGHMHTALQGVLAVMSYGVASLLLAGFCLLTILGTVAFFQDVIPKWWGIAWKR